MDENIETPETQKKRRKRDIIFNTFLVLFSVIALAIAGVLIYQKRYLSPFWVNGQSMYPTLNKKAVNANGQLLGVEGGAASVGCRNLDYGVMDKHKSALENLKRFDIVVCKYSFGDESDKIKRLVGMPGETIKFGQGSDNGTLYLKNGDDFDRIEQPIPNEYIVAGNYPTTEYKLADNEYFVLGDNRAYSSDSRTNSPITFDLIVGKVVAICAHCEVKLGSDGSLEPFNIQHYIPLFL